MPAGQEGGAHASPAAIDRIARPTAPVAIAKPLKVIGSASWAPPRPPPPAPASGGGPPRLPRGNRQDCKADGPRRHREAVEGDWVRVVAPALHRHRRGGWG